MGEKTGDRMVFQRYEIKYLITGRQKEKILTAMAPYMEQDEHGRSTIRNLYYDTDNYRLVRASLEGPVYKEKLRVRSYRQAGAEDEVFCELKKKYESVVYKRRFGMPYRCAEKYLSGEARPAAGSQIMAEMDYFLQFYKTLEPKVFLSYEREAYFARKGQAAGEFRVTFDENILWRETELSLGKGIYGEAILSPGQVLMELKTSGGIPLWMVRVLSEEGLRKTSFSKYGNAYQRIYAEKNLQRKRGSRPICEIPAEGRGEWSYA